VSDYYNKIGLFEFLSNQNLMSIKTTERKSIVVEGEYYFNSFYKNITIEDSYQLRIRIPDKYPNELIQVWELLNKITEEISNGHMFKDKSLCLGSPFKIHAFLSKNPSINAFADSFITPYLFAISNKIRNGGDLIFGELKHNFAGLVQDYFNTQNDEDLATLLSLINMKKRNANKKSCPCGCGLRLGKCNVHHEVNYFRNLKYRMSENRKVSRIQ
jgi:hypothetical protein